MNIQEKDLIIDKIYYITKDSWSCDYIQLFKGITNYSPLIQIPKNGSGGLVFYHSHSWYSCFYGVPGLYRLATNKESKWLEECIKANKFIPLDQIKLLIEVEIY